MQLVFLSAPLIEFFPKQISDDVPYALIQISFPLLMCSCFATCVPSLVLTLWPHLRVLLESQSPPVPSFGVAGNRLEKVLLFWGGDDLAPVLPGRPSRQGWGHCLGKGQLLLQPAGPLPGDTWRDAACGTTQPR